MVCGVIGLAYYTLQQVEGIYYEGKLFQSGWTIILAFCCCIGLTELNWTGTMMLSPHPHAANTPLVSHNKWECKKLNDAGQPCFTSASTYFKLNKATFATLVTDKAGTLCKLAPKVKSREQATQSITGLVDFSQSIPRMVPYYKFFIIWQGTCWVIACPLISQNTVGAIHNESETTSLPLAN